MTTKERVRKASEQFYDALNRILDGDAAPMEEIWSHGAEVTAMHPAGGREVGGNAVTASWEELAEMASGGEVALGDQLICVGGELAYEIGDEHVEVTLGGERVESVLRVTNIYRKTAGKWRIIHHHTDADATMQEVVGQLEE